MSSLKELEERKKRMYQLIDKMVAEEDMTLMLQTVQQIESEAHALEQAALMFQAKMEKEGGKPLVGGFEVVLTPEQRSKVQKETGVSMMSVIVPDTSGTANAAMPNTRPETILAIALEQAKSRKTGGDAKEKSKMEVERQLRLLEEQNELVAAQVAELRKDPRFREAIGLDEKKKK